MLRFASARSSLAALLLAAPAWFLAGCSVDRVAAPLPPRPDAGVEECVDDTMCDDGMRCTIDRCEVVSGVRRCVHVPEDTECASIVRPGDVCRMAVCRPDEDTFDGTPDGCILVDRPDETPCDDGTYCNGADHCQDGECVPVEGPDYVLTCRNGRPCNTSIDTCGCNADADCDPESGKPRCYVDMLQCVECLEDDDCGDPERPRCDTDRTCKCLSHTDCDDGNPCTVDTCGADGACGHVPVPAGGGRCSLPGGTSGYCDGRGGCVECTEASHCGTRTCSGWSRCGGFSDDCDETGTQSRTCQQPTCLGNRCGTASEPETRACTRNTDGTSCDDGRFCTATDRCVSGSCQGSGSPCSGSTPVCIEASGLCVECRSNADCSGSTPVCDTSTNTCVQCLGDADCSGRTPYCVGNQCVECRSAGDCGDGNPCTDDVCSADGTCSYPLRPARSTCSLPGGGMGYCTAGGSCLPCLNTTSGGVDLGCADPTPACDQSAGVCVACTDDTDCDDRVACTTDTCDSGSGSGNTCTYAPIDAACDDGNPCTVDTCDPEAGCQNSNASPGTPCPMGVCDGSGTCVSCIPRDIDGNNIDEGCTNGSPGCVSGTCVECRIDAHCSGGQTCQADNKCG